MRVKQKNTALVVIRQLRFNFLLFQHGRQAQTITKPTQGASKSKSNKLRGRGKERSGIQRIPAALTISRDVKISFRTAISLLYASVHYFFV